MKILIYQTPTCNIVNVARAIRKLGYNFEVKKLGEKIQPKNYDTLVIPGVGNFGFVMKELMKNDFKDAVLQFQSQNKIILGICLGFQILFEASEESPYSNGMGLLKGNFRCLPNLKQKPSPPKIGFSDTRFYNREKDILSNADFYYLHKYALMNIEDDFDLVGKSNYYDVEYISFVKKNNIFGCQFHPELSGELGLLYLKKILLGFNES